MADVKGNLGLLEHTYNLAMMQLCPAQGGGGLLQLSQGLKSFGKPEMQPGDVTLGLSSSGPLPGLAQPN